MNFIQRVEVGCSSSHRLKAATWVSGLQEAMASLHRTGISKAPSLHLEQRGGSDSILKSQSLVREVTLRKGPQSFPVCPGWNREALFQKTLDPDRLLRIPL